MKPTLYLAVCASAALLMAFTLPAFTETPGVAADLRATTVPGTHITSGTLITTDDNAMVFHAAGQPDIAMPYDRITEIHLVDKQTLHLGVLPAIFVYLVTRPIKHHTLSITYSDSADALQVVTLEMAELQRNDAMLVLESRSKQACLDRGEFGTCQPIVLPPRTPMTVPRDGTATPTAAPAKP